MPASASAFASHQLDHLVGDFYSRRLLLHNPLYPPPISPSSTSHDASSSSPDQYPGDNSFDANVVMVLSVLLCALICSLGLNSIIKCALRCSSFVAAESSSSSNNSARLANTGVKKKALKTFPTVSYSAEIKLPGLDSECMICLSEFTTGERVRLLPKCNHGFHVRCIDKWLSSHSSCPKCRQSLIETCQKIVGFSQAAGSSSLNPTNSADGSADAEETDFVQQPNTDAVTPRSPVICKPFENAYVEAFKIANINPQRTLFFDDSIRNLETAKQVGLQTVWVGTSHRTKDVDHALESIHNMREALPELWAEQSENVIYSREVGIETPVEA